MLRVYLTGELCLTSSAAVVRSDRFPGRQGRLAFVLLAAERSRPVARDELIELLWPADAPAAVEVALSAVISKLRSLLADVGLSRNALTSIAHCHQLRLPADAWIDLEAAAEAVHGAESALRSGAHADAYGPAVVANAIVRRPFLPGDDGPWIEGRRRALLDERLRALDCLAEIHNWNREPTLARKAAEEAVSLEPYRESGYRRLMKIHDEAGNAAESLRVYERLRLLLASDLGAEPTSETQALLQQLHLARARTSTSA